MTIHSKKMPPKLPGIQEHAHLEAAKQDKTKQANATQRPDKQKPRVDLKKAKEGLSRIEKNHPHATRRPSIHGDKHGLHIKPRTPEEIAHEEKRKADIMKKVPWLADVKKWGDELESKGSLSDESAGPKIPVKKGDI